MYLPLHDSKERNILLRIPFKYIYYFASFLPLFSFITCVLLTMVKDFESANHTHCKVENVFPSISAAIGNYFPQNLIWKLSIYIHFPPRILTVYLRFSYYSNVINRKVLFLVYIAALLNFIENLALLGLTHWNSSLNYPYHEVCFKTFIASSLIYILLISVLLTKYRRNMHTLKDRRSLSLKWKLFLTNALSFALAAYFFVRHNNYCEPFVYSLFGLTEYVVVVTNIAFHMTTILDFDRLDHVLFTKTGVILSQ